MIEVKKLLSLDTCFDQETSFYSIVPLLCMFPFEFLKKKKSKWGKRFDLSCEKGCWGNLESYVCLIKRILKKKTCSTSLGHFPGDLQMSPGR